MAHPPSLRRAELSEASDIADNGAHHGYRQRLVVSGGVLRDDRFAELLEPLRPVREAWVSWIEPGGFIVEHIDGGPYFERWQIPLSESGVLIQGDEPVAHTVGVPFRVEQWRWHSVRNDSNQPRVSLVVDRDIPAGVPTSRFRLKG